MITRLFEFLAFYVDNWWGRTATTGIFIAAAVTDWLDGYIARKVCLFFSYFSYSYDYSIHAF